MLPDAINSLLGADVYETSVDAICALVGCRDSLTNYFPTCVTAALFDFSVFGLRMNSGFFA
jgi:hypothetical protein